MSPVSGSVIVAGARTPIGRLLGSLKDFTAPELGGFAIKAALEKAGVAPDKVEYVIMGQVLTAGVGQIPARQAAVHAGISMDVPALTINKVCLSGLDAIALADQLIRAGEFDVIVAGGQESMTQAPHLLPKSRSGFKYGDTTLVDHMAYDGLFCAFDQMAMGAATEKYNSRYGLTRAEQDEFSARSHQRAAAAIKDGVFVDEITPVGIPQRKGDPIVFDTDEGVRGDTTADSLGKLRPAFAADGTITAGSASQISDGAAAVVVMSKAKAQELGLTWLAEIGSHGNVAGSASQISDGAAAVVVMSKAKAEELGLTWLAEIGAHGVVAGPDPSLHEQPSNAIKKACQKAGINPSDLDVVEINEAFAAVGVVSARELGLSEDKVNVNGGAIAVGHPIGMSGARIALHLALELKRRGGGVGAAGMCGGGGQGDALIIKVPSA
jgi:acetyl-CoA C-acetyltransferase